MIDPTTGMKAGERYSVENVERAHQFPGFFLDGKYYLGPELLTAVGWLEGKRFIYDNLDATGQPIFPDRAAGDIDDLTLTLVDGTALKLNRLEVSAMNEEVEAIAQSNPDIPRYRSPGAVESPDNLRAPQGRPQGLEGVGLTRKDKIPLLLSAAAIGFLTGLLITHAQRRRR
ncbi:short-chain dehydrogenase [Pseudomonas monteilii]|uniref:Short-chain dehydrogenase n=1 Tax=Pseudomonas monteilii TaxID=76759 RepID=A0AAE6REV7_9PSED|nr:short-chain dehydrogenase [Pseudomonas monteilii]